MEELARLAGTEAAQGQVILAHLGNGASLAAVRDGKSVDTSMRFTPKAGVQMHVASISIVEMAEHGPILRMMGDRSYLREELRRRVGT